MLLRFKIVIRFSNLVMVNFNIIFLRRLDYWGKKWIGKNGVKWYRCFNKLYIKLFYKKIIESFFYCEF